MVLTKRFEMLCSWRISHRVLKETEKQAYLDGSVEGLEAAVEEMVVVAGKRLMAELWLRICFRMADVRNS